jgi:hypothetical protein
MRERKVADVNVVLFELDKASAAGSVADEVEVSQRGACTQVSLPL